MKHRILIKGLKINGWSLKRITGSHYHFKHSTIPGLITVPCHRDDDLHPAIVHNILKMAKLSLGDFTNSKKVKKPISNYHSGVIDAITNRY